nr:retrovirus-related Pol polyprotein from transposon TNT 1-94 [Tanacetum cinerariifolium]
MWNDLILAHEGPYDTKDTKIVALRLMFNAFKSLEGEKVMGTFTRMKCLLNDLENNDVTIPQAEVNATFVNSLPRKWLSVNQTQRDGDSDVEKDQRTSNEFMADLIAKYHERALLANQTRLYKRSGRVRSTRKPIDKTKETWIRAFMAVAEDEPSVGKADARTGQWVDITMKKNEVIRVNLENESLKDEISELKRVIKKWTCSKVTLHQLLSKQIPGNIVKALGGKGRRKENNPSKEVLFNKADVSTSESAPMITSNSEDDSDIQEPLSPLPKLTRVDPFGASKSPFSLSDLTANMTDLTLNTASKEIRKSFNKVSQTYVITKRTEFKHPTAQNSCPDKNALPLTEQLLLTLMEEVKDYLKWSVWYLDSGCSRHMTGVKQYLHGYSKEPGPKVVFRDDSLGDTEGYSVVNCNGITFTMVSYVNGLKHNLISISQLCDANFKVL